MSFRSRIDIGINDNRFLFVLQVVVRNLRDEGRFDPGHNDGSVDAAIMIFVTNLTTFAQSTCQVGLRNFYKSAIINWKMMRATSKLAQFFI